MTEEKEEIEEKEQSYPWLSSLISYFQRVKDLDDEIEVIRVLICESPQFSPLSLFNHLDCNHKCFLTLNDFKSFLRSQKSFFDERRLRKVIHNFDKDNDFSINLDEFLGLIIPRKNSVLRSTMNCMVYTYCYDYCVTPEVISYFNDLLLREMKLVKELDQIAAETKNSIQFSTYEAFLAIVEDDKYMTKFNLNNFLKKNEVIINDEEVEQLMFRLDSDNDDKISYEEFKEMFYPLKGEFNYVPKKEIKSSDFNSNISESYKYNKTEDSYSNNNKSYKVSDYTKNDYSQSNYSKNDYSNNDYCKNCKNDYCKNNYSKYDYNKKDYSKSDYSKNDYSKNGYSKNDNSKNDYSKNDYSKNDYSKNDYNSNNYSKNDYNKNDFSKNDYNNNDNYSKNDNDYEYNNNDEDKNSGKKSKKTKKVVLRPGKNGTSSSSTANVLRSKKPIDDNPSDNYLLNKTSRYKYTQYSRNKKAFNDDDDDKSSKYSTFNKYNFPDENTDINKNYNKKNINSFRRQSNRFYSSLLNKDKYNKDDHKFDKYDNGKCKACILTSRNMYNDNLRDISSSRISTNTGNNFYKNRNSNNSFNCNTLFMNRNSNDSTNFKASKYEPRKEIYKGKDELIKKYLYYNNNECNENWDNDDYYNKNDDNNGDRDRDRDKNGRSKYSFREEKISSTISKSFSTPKIYNFKKDVDDSKDNDNDKYNFNESNNNYSYTTREENNRNKRPTFAERFKKIKENKNNYFRSSFSLRTKPREDFKRVPLKGNNLKEKKNLFFKLLVDFIEGEKSNEKIRGMISEASDNIYFDLFEDIKQGSNPGIQRDDIDKFMKENGYEAKDDEIEIIMGKMDKNNDGIIDYEEFIGEVKSKNY